MTVPETTFKIELNGKDATKDLTPYLMSLTYKDALTGKADELHIEVDNSDNRFLNEWFFSPGMKVKAWIGQMFCGEFMVDEPTESGPPHVAGFKAQSALFSGPIRTKKSFSHHAKSLKDIVKKYADDHKLKVVGTIPDLNLNCVIQMKESDIDFLHRLAHTYGCVCSIKGGNLVFDMWENVWKVDAAKTIHWADVMSYSFTTSLPESADAAIAVYDQAYEGKTEGAVVTDGELNNVKVDGYDILTNYKFKSNFNPSDYQPLDEDYQVQSNIVKIVHKKAESKEEAKRIATGELLRKKNRKHTCNLTLPGNELLVSGNSINLLEFGKRSGYWLINTSTHKITKGGGYVTNIEVSHGAATTGNKAPVDKKVEPQINSNGGGGSKVTVMPANNL